MPDIEFSRCIAKIYMRSLSNVIQRLRMFYNKEDVIEITSVGKNMGTEVAIKLYWRGEV